MYTTTITRTVRSFRTWLWGRYHVPQNAFLVDDATNFSGTFFSYNFVRANFQTWVDSSTPNLSEYRVFIVALKADLFSDMLLRFETHAPMSESGLQVQPRSQPLTYI